MEPHDRVHQVEKQHGAEWSLADGNWCRGGRRGCTSAQVNGSGRGERRQTVVGICSGTVLTVGQWGIDGAGDNGERGGIAPRVLVQ
jgi:hypothetical protein